MAYAEIVNVQNLMAQFDISSTTTPDDTQTNAIITDMANEIDVALSAAGVAVPVASPGYFYEWLVLLNSYGAAAAVLKSMFPDAVGEGTIPAYAFWEERYQNGLKGIKDGSLVPETALPGGNAVLPSTYLTRNPDEEEHLGLIAEPLFKIGQVF